MRSVPTAASDRRPCSPPHRTHVHAATGYPWSPCPMPTCRAPWKDGNIYLCSPEWRASFARGWVKAGVRFNDGCCGTTPSSYPVDESYLRTMAAMEITHRAVKAGRLRLRSSPRRWPSDPRLGGLIPGGTLSPSLKSSPQGVACERELSGGTDASLGIRFPHRRCFRPVSSGQAHGARQSMCLQD